MSTTNTNGYDLVLQVSEAALGGMIEAQPGIGLILFTLNNVPLDPARPDGPSFSLSPVSSSPGPRIDLDFDAPGTAQNRLRVRFHFASARLRPAGGAVTSLGPARLVVTGEFDVTADTAASTWVFALRLNWSDPASRIEWQTAPSGPALDAITAAGYTPDTLSIAMRSAIRATWDTLLRPLGVDIDRPLSTPIAASFGTPPLVIEDLRARVQRDTRDLVRDDDFLALLLQFQSGPHTATSPDAPVLRQIPSGSEVGMILSTPFIEREVCRLIRSNFGGMPDPANPCAVPPGGETVTINGAQYQLFEMRTTVNDADDSLTVSMALTQSGVGWHATANIDVTIRLQIQTQTVNGVPQAQLVPTVVGQPNARVEVFLEWWLYLIGVLVGAILFIINPAVGVVFAAVYIAVLAIITAIASSVASGQASAGIGAGVASNAVVLPPELTALLGAMTMQTVLLDDLTVGMRAVPPTPPDVRAVTVNQHAGAGAGFDLDAGTVVANVSGDGNVDLIWGPSGAGMALSPRNGARLIALAERRFLDLSLADLQHITYPVNTAIDISRLPIGAAGAPPPSTPVLAVRTSAGRYAKCLAWRDAGGQLHLHYVTYESTAAGVRLSPVWTILSREEIGRGYDAFLRAEYRDFRVSRRGEIRAYTTALTAPLQWAFYLDDQPIDGRGRVTVDGGAVDFTVGSGLCTLVTEIGRDLRATLSVRVVDATGLAAAASIAIEQAGVAREYGRSALMTLLDELTRRPIGLPPGQGPDPDPIGPLVSPEIVLRTALVASMGDKLKTAGITAEQIRIM